MRKWKRLNMEEEEERRARRGEAGRAREGGPVFRTDYPATIAASDPGARQIQGFKNPLL